MARRERIVFVSDLSGTETEDGETVEFGFDGMQFEVDLTAAEAEELRGELKAWAGHGRRTGGRAKRGAGVKAAANNTYNRDTLREIRRWARGQGFRVSDRGRLPSEVTQAWESAHAGRAA